MADIRRVMTLRDSSHLNIKGINGSRGVDLSRLASSTDARTNDTSESSGLTAASQIVTDIQRYRSFWYETWQEEAWSFYESLGEFNYGVEWFSEALSRVRLTAAKVTPGGDEPEVLDSGPASELVTQFMGGIDGQSQLLRSLAIQLSVAGDSYFVGREVTDTDIAYGLLMDAEPDEDGRIWTVNPANTLRRRRGRFVDFLRRSQQSYQWEMQLDEAVWVPLPPESLVLRIWDRNEHFPWRSMSPAKAALPIMREIDMYNRHIIASLVSRVAMNGLLFIPDEVTLPASAQYENASDPFIAELLDIMMAAIKNPGSPAAAAPVPVRIPSEFIDKFKHMSFATPIDEKVFESRAQAIQRLAATLNLPQEIITGLGTVNHWCVDDITEVLTRDRGWVTHPDLCINDIILTLNHNTGASEWQPVLDIYRANVIDEPMISLESRTHSSLTTKQHRWPVLHAKSGQRTWKTSDTLNTVDQLIRAAPHADIPTDPKWSDAFVELVGWLWTDGRLTVGGHKKHVRMTLSQSQTANPHKVARIRNALTKLYGDAYDGSLCDVRCDDINGAPRWREVTRNDLACFSLNIAASAPFSNIMTLSPYNLVSRDFIYSLTQSQLELFIDASIQGDGSGQKLTQSDPVRLDAFELAVMLSGRAVSRFESWHQGFAWHKMYMSSIQSQPIVGSNGRKTTGTSYTGTIWCPVTNNATWMARRNGKVFFTGNSSWQLTEDAIKIHISPKVEIITRALTLGYLHPMLTAMGESTRASDGSRIIIWYDTSELTQRPDRSGAAVTLREMMVITDKAARRETGFDEADAPTDDELEKMILMKLAVNPRTAAPALKELTGLEFDILPEEELRQSSQNETMVTTNQHVIDSGQPIADSPDTQDDDAIPPDQAAVTAALHRLPVDRRAAVLRRAHSIQRRARESLTRSE